MRNRPSQMYDRRKMSQMGQPRVSLKNCGGTAMRILSYWRPHLFCGVVILVLTVVSIVASLTGPYILGIALDECFGKALKEGVNMPLLLSYLEIFVGVSVVASLSSWGEDYLLKSCSLKVTKRMGEEVFLKFEKLTLPHYVETRRGEMMNHFTNDLELLKNAMANSLLQLISSVLMLVGSLIVMLNQSWALTIVSCFTIPFTVLLSRYTIRRTRRFFKQHQFVFSQMSGKVEEDISGMRTIQHFNHERESFEEFERLNEEVCQTGRKAQIYSGVLMPSLRVLDNLSYLFITVFGVFFCAKGMLSVGMIQTFLLYTKNFQRPVNAIANQVNAIQSALAAGERIFSLLDKADGFAEEESQPLVVNEGVSISFENVWFGYDKENPIIKGVTFNVRPNEMVAIVGTTGAGKSTMISLLQRFYEIQEGNIKINGVDIRRISKKVLRRLICVVLQDPFLFSESIYYNIAYGKEDATESEVRRAARAAEIDDFILSQPRQYEQPITNGGEEISNGQQQLLTIARAILCDAPILVFDEATSGIDTRTELQIQNVIRRLSANKTCIVIAHRLSTVRNADKIIVLNHGRIVEQGSHEQLLQRRGFYYDFCAKNGLNEE